MNHWDEQKSRHGGRVRVVLEYGPLGLVQAVTERIAHDHMLVNTGTITLNHNAELAIVVSLPGEKHHESHRIAAKVLQCDEHGLSLLGFHCCGEKTMMALLPFVTRH